MKKKISLLLALIIGMSIGLGVGLYLRRPSKDHARFIDITDVSPQWKNGEIAYLRRHGDTTSLERYYGGKNQRHPDNIRVVTRFNPNDWPILEGKISDLPFSSIQMLRQLVHEQAKSGKKNTQDTSTVADTSKPSY